MHATNSQPPVMEQPGPSPADVASSLVKTRRRVPSGRNLEIYRLVAVGQRSQSEVADEYELTQQRVAQIVELVRDWLQQVTLPEMHGLSPERLLNFATNHHSLLLEETCAMSLRAWEKSTRPYVSEKTSVSSSGEVWKERIERPSYGKTACLTQARMASKDWARLAGVDLSGRGIRQAAEQQRAERLAAAIDQATESAPAETPSTATTPSPQVNAPPAVAPLATLQAPCKPLWKSAASCAAQKPVTATPLAANVAAKTTCEKSSRPNCPPAGPQNDFANPCSPAVAAKSLLLSKLFAPEIAEMENKLVQPPAVSSRRQFLSSVQLHPQNPAEYLKTPAKAAA